MARIDFDRAAAFIAAVREGRWTAYKDVAETAGSPQGTQAVGDWLRRHGDRVEHAYRVLRVDGVVPAAFRPAGPGLPVDSGSVRDRLKQEGARIDDRGRAPQKQRFAHKDWRSG